ncbi:hypothetical protein ROZALSC1DRAFT_31072 [Rozella allomycis CSF55]|uniref:Uncharacterized protein n=1 Tax=Rozella allomycis (strain CSF55) TaxID=988480 RepID=A0A4P9YD30_ROZAC|nr:hypothetical protein ROZALSC1DRAFT_31072 [Rozella allomycis CSF55]
MTLTATTSAKQVPSTLNIYLHQLDFTFTKVKNEYLARNVTTKCAVYAHGCSAKITPGDCESLQIPATTEKELKLTLKDLCAGNLGWVAIGKMDLLFEKGEMEFKLPVFAAQCNMKSRIPIIIGHCKVTVKVAYTESNVPKTINNCRFDWKQPNQMLSDVKQALKLRESMLDIRDSLVEFYESKAFFKFAKDVAANDTESETSGFGEFEELHSGFRTEEGSFIELEPEKDSVTISDAREHSIREQVAIPNPASLADRMVYMLNEYPFGINSFHSPLFRNMMLERTKGAHRKEEGLRFKENVLVEYLSVENNTVENVPVENTWAEIVPAENAQVDNTSVETVEHTPTKVEMVPDDKVQLKVPVDNASVENTEQFSIQNLYKFCSSAHPLVLNSFHSVQLINIINQAKAVRTFTPISVKKINLTSM